VLVILPILLRNSFLLLSSSSILLPVFFFHTDIFFQLGCETMKTVLKILIAVVSVLCAIAIFQAMSLTSRQISRPPRDDAPVLASQGNIFAEHLAQAIRIKTVSFDDPALVDTKAIQGQFFSFFFFLPLPFSPQFHSFLLLLLPLLLLLLIFNPFKTFMSSWKRPILSSMRRPPKKPSTNSVCCILGKVATHHSSQDCSVVTLTWCQQRRTTCGRFLPSRVWWLGRVFGVVVPWMTNTMCWRCLRPVRS